MSDTTQKVLTIVRSEWRRGGQSAELRRAFGNTQLLNDWGFKCCLGFDALAHGIPESDIRGRMTPSGITSTRISVMFPAYVSKRVTERGTNTDTVMRAIHANDNTLSSDSAREAAVRTALIALGWDDVVFVD